MNTEPLVSVVIIFWNAERFLEEAIESVLGQSYAAWELLLVDDGSSDGSTAIARRYAELRPERVRYLEHPYHANRGMSASRNRGLRAGRGPYVAFLDADDVWFPDTLREQVGHLEAHPEAAMLYGPIQWWYSWTGRPDEQERDYVEALGVPADAVMPPPGPLPLFLRDRAAVPSGIMARREVVERVGGFEEAFRGEYEDQVFCAKVCLAAPVLASETCWYRYRQHPDSCVVLGHRTGETHAARLRFLTWLATYLSEHQVRAWSVWWALELELWRCRYPLAFNLLGRANHFAGRIKGLVARRGRG